MRLTEPFSQADRRASTGMLAPLMCWDSSDARNRANQAISVVSQIAGVRPRFYPNFRSFAFGMVFDEFVRFGKPEERYPVKLSIHLESPT